MNDQVKFKRLQELAGALADGLDALQSGKLSVKQLEELTESSRELYERLVVLRFKAYDEHSKGQPVAVAMEKEVEEEYSIPFKIDTSQAPNQVSLIDAIEEVTKSEVLDEEPVAVTPPPVTVPPVANQNAAESLNERLSKAVGAMNTLAQKLESTPIPDLKRAITLNQRFQFSRELFKGNNQDYEVAIDKLNNTTLEEALQHIEQLRSKYAWNNEAQVTLDFVELIERRYQ